MSGPGPSRLAITSLVLGMALAIGACDRLPTDAPARIGRGIEAAGRGDHGEAYWLWRPLADAGMAEAQYHLGWLYANGDGLRVDVPKAILWWERAAANGYPDAEFAIGMAYLNGEPKTLKKDFGKALEWFVRAARQGNPDAREILERLLRSETGKVIEVRPGILMEDWLGARLEVVADKAAILAQPGREDNTLATPPPGTVLRGIDERKGWLLVILPDGSGLGWIAARDAKHPAGP